MNDLTLTKYNPITGEVEYEGRVTLLGDRGGSTLTFTVTGQVGANPNTPWVQLHFDPHESTSFEAGLLRMADWLEAAARACRGVLSTKTFLEASKT